MAAVIDREQRERGVSAEGSVLLISLKRYEWIVFGSYD
jgi:hypothetical protein